MHRGVGADEGAAERLEILIAQDLMQHRVVVAERLDQPGHVRVAVNAEASRLRERRSVGDMRLDHALLAE